MNIKGQYPDSILTVITYAEYAHAQISPFLVRSGGSRRRRLQINSIFIYSSTRELRTHVAIALFWATGASTTYAPSAKAAAKLVIEFDTSYVAMNMCILRLQRLNKEDPECMTPKVAIADKTKANVLDTMNASKAYLRACIGVPPLLRSSAM
jgi:hypothetical protein